MKFKLDGPYINVNNRVNVFFIVPVLLLFGWIGIEFSRYILLTLVFIAGFTVKYIGGSVKR